MHTRLHDVRLHHVGVIKHSESDVCGWGIRGGLSMLFLYPGALCSSVWEQCCGFYPTREPLGLSPWMFTHCCTQRGRLTMELPQ
jgi:hypothetical protein